jgi:anti-anti-sigma factor
MEIESVAVNEVMAVAVKGRVDSTNADDLKERLTTLIRSGSARLLIDMQGVIYISSAGFRVLLIAARAIEQASGQLVLCGIGGELKRLFDIAAFADLFTILPSRDEALALLQTPSGTQ